MIIKLLRYNVLEKTFFSRVDLDRYVNDNIGKGVPLAAYGYSVKEEK